MIAGSVPKPTSGINIAKTARLGIEYSTPRTDNTGVASHLTLVKTKPIGSAKIRAIPSATPTKVIVTDEKVNNGKIEVPAVLLEPIAVNRNNMEATIIADGFHQKHEVFMEYSKNSV